ncbi:hypothetical protein K443DRAFT_130711 [Laccaria amethystina LaAM-08-1]|uniref:MutL C-terminal dimerisation domain-containing protein n=1 Tax=Laccaria amethystina LaAM-08-1 TaxID=1095629 RepID=A0A0C9Y9K1_9AGAR|nr:hypothetical protein K443DRAFT_130711 [Laccaria amethystina LaAM-08-1]
MLQGGKTLYTGPAVRWRRETQGTVVCIRDAFYNLPVRRLSHPSHIRTWELVRQEIETYAIVFPHVAFSLEDSRNARETDPRTDRKFRIPKTSSILSAFRRIYGRALTEHIEEIDATRDSMKIVGFISLNGSLSKARTSTNTQFLTAIFVVSLTRALALVHFPKMFILSSYPGVGTDATTIRPLKKMGILAILVLTEKKPVYVLNVTLPSDHVDNIIEPSKTSVQFQVKLCISLSFLKSLTMGDMLKNRASLLSFISSVIESFLMKHGFVLRHDIGPTTLDSPSRKRRKFEKNFDDSGFTEGNSVSEPPISLHNHHSADGSNLVLYTSTEDNPSDILWIDPITHEKFLVDARSGNSYRQGDSQSGEPSSGIRQGRRTLQHKHVTSSALRKADHPIPAWLQKALQENEVYSLSEKRIASLELSASMCPPAVKNHSFHTEQHQCHASKDENFARSLQSDALSRPLTREDLQQAQIIGQVDRKFIACAIPVKQPENGLLETFQIHREPTSTSPALVLIDQHAADERIRVECFLKELCLGFLHYRDEGSSTEKGVTQRGLQPPLPVLLTRHEAILLKASLGIQRTFHNWGFQFDLSEVASVNSDDVSANGSSSGYEQLLVCSVPEVVSEKLLQGEELRDLVKSCLAYFQYSSDSSQTIHSTNLRADEFAWLGALRLCPKALLDLVNSKACRGAIMFNDHLTVEQCQKLVYKLSQTSFPFQCAHGRPSLVPLMNLWDYKGHPARQLERSQYRWSRLENDKEASI